MIEINKNIITIFFTIILFLPSFSNFAIAEDENNNEIKLLYSFEKPDIVKIIINNKNYDKIIMSGATCMGNVGEPNLPIYDIKILLPIQKEIEEINVNIGKKILIDRDLHIEPVLQQNKLSEINNTIIIFENSSIYNSNIPFPKSPLNNVKTNYFRGYEILFLTLHPVQFIPLTGELYYFQNITLSIKTKEKIKQNMLFRNNIKDKIAILDKIDNSNIIDNFVLFKNKFTELFSYNEDNYDLLILTINEFRNDFLKLKEFHDLEGLKTEIKTIENISTSNGIVNPEDIRNFIKNEYLTYGIEYVLIAGDEDIIPAKELWVESIINEGNDVFMPSDLYYACLDGPFNYDGDNRWGEPTDGENGNDVDLVAEVYVGRACVSDINEIDNFINKTIKYLNTYKYDNNRVLMVGELLWDTPKTWASDYMNELINGSNNNFYQTIGIPSNKYFIDTLYDYSWLNNDWPKSIIINKINNGTDVINHLGHSSYSYNMKIKSDDVYLLKNEDPFFIYSQGCYSGGFDIGDSISEYFTVKTKNAAYSAIMNARSGWGMSGSTDGASQRFHREFWDAVFGENITEIGKANQDSKEDLLTRINYPCMRWCYYQLNLLGDPTLKFYDRNNDNPGIPSEPIGKKLGKTDKEYIFSSESLDNDDDHLFYRWDWGDGTFSNWIGPFDSGEKSNMSHIWNRAGKYFIRVKTCDEHRAESEWSENYSIYIIKNLNFSNILKKINEILEILNVNI